VPYISKSNCCPPNVVRTVAEVSNYAYSISDKGVWLNLYGGNVLSTKLKNGAGLKLAQETNYPWDGQVKVKVEEAPNEAFSMFLRIPGWSKGAKVLVNGKAQTTKLTSGAYAELNRKWAKGDVVELVMPMPATLIESNPLVEETRNQVAVKRGPVVYCIESVDHPGQKIMDVTIPANISLKPKMITIENSPVLSLEGKAKLIETGGWKNQLYKEVATSSRSTPVRLIPYYAWGNRGQTEMNVWLPLSR
jgi:uncharacterized protein